MKTKKLPKLIFSVTTGRSGTTYLTYLLSGLNRTVSVHEEKPYFSNVMRKVQADTLLADKFWAEEKIPAIQNMSCDFYIETSHVFCKGFFESLLKNHQVPDLIVLRRSARQIAKSLHRLNTVPGRTKGGRKWYLQPDDPVMLKIQDWQSLSDYQLCYWYCLEIEARAQKYAETIRSLGGKVSEVSLDGLRTSDDFPRLLKELQLPRMPLRYRIRNAIKKRVKRNASVINESANERAAYDEQENQVLSKIDKNLISLDKFLP